MRFAIFLAALSLAAASGVAQPIPGRYIVELDAPPAADLAPPQARRAAGMNAHRAGVRRSRENLRAAIENESSITESYDTLLNGFAVATDEAGAETLRAMPGVKRVVPDMQVRLLLDRAADVHKLMDVWAQTGGEDAAGAGIKIAIIDTGIDNNHPGFQDPSLQPPPGYPKLGKDSYSAYVNNKIIVARSYANGVDPADDDGHGTAVAMSAAGIRNSGPYGSIVGMAPKAFLGNYRVFGGSGASSSAVLRAIEDAVNDGMDIINLSLGVVPAPKPDSDIQVDLVERAVKSGVLVVTAAGNDGPQPLSISSPATAPSAIAVGATWSDRLFRSEVAFNGKSFDALKSTGPLPDSPIDAKVADVATLDKSGLACSAFPPDSLKDSVAFILRGNCFFEDKLKNAAAAGAIAAVVYSTPASPEPVNMDIGTANLPSVMLSNEDGVTLKALVGASPASRIRVDVAGRAAAVKANRLASFSSRGPNTDNAVKPDLVAIGVSVSTAAEKINPAGDIYGPTGYAVENGTSFASPITAGALATLMTARPGLKPADYRSLIINYAAPIQNDDTSLIVTQQQGAGRLNVLASLNGQLSISPVSVSFGSTNGSVSGAQAITVRNIGASADTFSALLRAGDSAITTNLSDNSFTLAPGESKTLTLRVSGVNLPSGEYGGRLVVHGASGGTDAIVPYWYGVPSDIPAFLSAPGAPDNGPRNRNIDFYVRITDAAGLPTQTIPTVTAPGAGTVMGIVALSQYPAIFRVTVRLTAPSGQNNVFHVEAADLKLDVTIPTA